VNFEKHLSPEQKHFWINVKWRVWRIKGFRACFDKLCDRKGESRRATNLNKHTRGARAHTIINNGSLARDEREMWWKMAQYPRASERAIEAEMQN